MQKVAVVVIPTYNEVDNIGKMLTHLTQKTFPDLRTTTSWQVHALVVDGASPDGTASLVQKFVSKNKNVHLLKETSKDGIGAAYLKGFAYAKDKLKAQVVMEMDGDFQHPPSDIIKYLTKIDQGFDYVCGSRKIAGGKNPEGWGFKRLFFSEVGGFVARCILFFPTVNFLKVTDPTTGFKATRVTPFVNEQLLDYKHLISKSFGYKLQYLWQ
jgi:dolichol-phosphate mannosyltransferase